MGRNDCDRYSAATLTLQPVCEISGCAIPRIILDRQFERPSSYHR
jgi:hypothetical protein